MDRDLYELVHKHGSHDQKDHARGAAVGGAAAAAAGGGALKNARGAKRDARDARSARATSRLKADEAERIKRSRSRDAGDWKTFSQQEKDPRRTEAGRKSAKEMRQHMGRKIIDDDIRRFEADNESALAGQKSKALSGRAVQRGAKARGLAALAGALGANAVGNAVEAKRLKRKKVAKALHDEVSKHGNHDQKDHAKQGAASVAAAAATGTGAYKNAKASERAGKKARHARGAEVIYRRGADDMISEHRRRKFKAKANDARHRARGLEGKAFKRGLAAHGLAAVSAHAGANAVVHGLELMGHRNKDKRKQQRKEVSKALHAEMHSS